jgi:DNA-binding transcriptional regulator YiaG
MQEQTFNRDHFASIQRQLGLSDGKMAAALGITRQTWRNWRLGMTCPEFAQNALRWLMELRRLSPANDNLPDRLRSPQ